MQHPSSANLIIGVVLDLICAFIGYRLSESYRKVLGRTPWGIPSPLWALLWFVFPLGTVLYVIAYFTSGRQAQKNPPMVRTPNGVPAPSAMERPRGPATASELFPAYPRPANSQPRGDPEPDSVEPPAAPQPVALPPTQNPPAWHPDPSERFHYRWWDGSQWTSQVSTDGHHLIDTNPDQRIGPY